MTRRLLFFFSVIAFATPQFISQIASNNPRASAQFAGPSSVKAPRNRYQMFRSALLAEGA